MTVDGDATVYMRFSGTSMAAAVTTGVVAQMSQANRETWGHGPWQKGGQTAPPLTPNAIKAILQYTAVGVAGADRLTQGAGALNGKGAVRLAAAIDTSAAVGQPWVRGAVVPLSTIDNEPLAWGETLIWGEGLVWHDPVAPQP